ncbi:MAG: ABC transporter permease [Oscillospiraceae bacterium]|nr:ABC transporter permease [Oscillospiraceae bacterium]
MKIFDVLGMGFRNLLRRKTRTFLTVIGVVVGATAIVIMLSLGIGMEVQLNKSLENMGDLTIITLYERSWDSVGDTNEWVETQNNLDEELMERLKSWDGVEAVSPFIWAEAGLWAGRNHQMQWLSIMGIDASFIPHMKLELERGYMPVPGDTGFVLFGRRGPYMFTDTRRTMRPRDWEALNNPNYDEPPKTNVFGGNLAVRARVWEIWNPETQQSELPPGAAKLPWHKIDKVGVLSFDDSRGWDEHEWNVYADYRLVLAAQKDFEKFNRVRVSESRAGKFSELRIKTTDIETTDRIIERLRDEEGILTRNWLASYRDELQGMMQAVQLLLGAIGAISLFVAAIGITNTMFMSIYERTKEIGVMKVLGCPLGGIQSMFLFEASIIGFCGGVLGSGLSIAGSFAVNRLEFVQTALASMGGMYTQEQIDISVIPLWLIGAAIIFSTLVGLVSGYLPSRRATKISALEAIRNE